MYFAGKIFDATLVEIDKETDMEITLEPTVTNPITDKSGPSASGSRETPGIEVQLAEIRANINNRHHNDRMVTARMREEIDWMMNLKKEDKFIVTGLVSQVAMPED